VTESLIYQATDAAVSAVASGAPRPLLKRVNFELDELKQDAISEAQLLSVILNHDSNDPMRKKFHFALLSWDSEEQPNWLSKEQSANSPALSRARRLEVLSRLGFSPESHDAITAEWPTQAERDIVISGSWDPWFTGDRRREQTFYWPHYRDLLASKGWKADALDDLDQSTTDVVERISDPLRAEAYQAKGLVVGYVQSGKTAHFTGTIAKAIDSGYRLVIVLAGTLDLLRNQTQRRLDMELVGTQGILGGRDPNNAEQRLEIDYQDDLDWLDGKFISHGDVRPSDAGYPDIRRLTGAKFDFTQLRTGLDALDFRNDLRDRAKPLFDRQNLFASDVRLIVIKKNPTVLRRLVKDLSSITARLGDIPSLIIDDESDQASVSTINPSRQKNLESEAKDRTATNGQITKLLGLLPRAQYVGYTATPFANVFVDPDDSADIFPKDFVIALKRPREYMGASDFHDMNGIPEGEPSTVATSNKLAYVRDLRGGSVLETHAEMQQALDAFVLSGAIKLFRQDQDSKYRYRHHTMLVHESTRQVEHSALALTLDHLWHQTGYSTAAALGRLEALWASDFREVSEARSDGAPNPTTFSELSPFLGKVIDKINSSGNPLLVVNGDKDLEKFKGELDFDTTDVWRILVGGTKLSRGFTVEGLTISYYKRRSLQADTLMQMGRWFGFRPGYKDLVRLYIDRNSQSGKRTFDLYEAFEAMVRDEEDFRAELRRYATLSDDGRPLVTPRQIPPLVTQQLPWLQPTSRNKRYNAVLVERGDGGQVKDLNLLPGPADGKSNLANFEALRPLLSAPRTMHTFLTDNGGEYNAGVAIIDSSTVLSALNAMRFDKSFDFRPQLEFLRKSTDARLITDWAIVFPQVKTGEDQEFERAGVLNVVNRNRRSEANRVGFSGSSARQRPAIQRIAGAAVNTPRDVVAENLSTPTRGAILVTAIKDPVVKYREEDPLSESDVALMLSYVAPLLSAPRGKLGFTVLSSSHAEDAIIDLADIEEHGGGRY